jgi:ABC-type phosphate transport system permease subunit
MGITAFSPPSRWSAVLPTQIRGTALFAAIFAAGVILIIVAGALVAAFILGWLWSGPPVESHEIPMLPTRRIQSPGVSQPLTSPISQVTMSLSPWAPLETTLLVIAIALPITAIIAGGAAAGMWDPPARATRIRRALPSSLGWMTGIPPVVIGAVLYFLTELDRSPHVGALSAAALVLLNLPNATAKFAHVGWLVPPEARDVSAALGVRSPLAFLQLVRLYASWACAAALFTLAAQMAGETAAIVLATAHTVGNYPLAASIWFAALDPRHELGQALACAVLIILVGIGRTLAHVCLRRQEAQAWH